MIPIEYDIAKPFNDKRVVVCKNWKWGVLDENNTVMVPLIYDDINESRTL